MGPEETKEFVGYVVDSSLVQNNNAMGNLRSIGTIKVRLQQAMLIVVVG